MRFYRLLLRLYPAAFRVQYEEELAKVFALRSRNASPPFARLLLWLESIADTLPSALAAHWDLLRQDLRYCARLFARSPGFAITAILVAALGVGATTAAYSVTDHVLLRPLPFPEANRLVKLWEDMSPGNYTTMEPSPANYSDWKRLSHSFSGMAAFRGLSVSMTGVGDPEQVEGNAFTSDLLPMLGARPLLGRIFSQADDQPGAPGTVILSYAMWQGRFGADPNILTRKIELDGEPYTVIGVMPGEFQFPRPAVQIWTAMRFKPEDFEDRNNNYLRVIAKLRPGVSREQARAEMGIVSEELRREYPKDNEHVGVTVNPLRDELSGRSRIMLFALLGASFCVLIISCTNLANLLLSRALLRQRELALRAALGAGRERLVRQMLTESLAIALLGGVVGIGLAEAAVPLLKKLVPSSLPIASVASIDGRVLLVSFALVVLTGLCFGLIPALRASGELAPAGLGERSGVSLSSSGERLRSGLIVGEIALSLVLVLSCGLLLRALWKLEQVDPGFRSEHVLTMRTALTQPRYEKVAVRTAFYDSVLARIRQTPGVDSAAFTSFLPIVMQGGIWPVAIAGQNSELDRAFHEASLRFVTPDFFRTLNIPLRSGRTLRESDGPKSQYVAVVSESFARQYWPKQDPLGRHFAFAFADRTVVGIVGNVRVRGLERESEPQVYLPYRQVGDGDLIWYAPKDLAIRSSLKIEQLLPRVRHIIAEADPQQPISDIQTLDEIVAEDWAPRRTQLIALGTFALIAILLTAIGIHGLLAFAVGSRTREIGVRMAVGAQPGQILGLVMGQSLLLALIGIALGLALSVAAARSVAGLLAGISPTDPATYTIAAFTAFAMACAGSFLPAIRALRVDPIRAIRAE
ncbi:MAG TPA: ABC transporter permease [Bryobacteraceae bacterium]|jgi:putative ABC transport system permease protein|nr:ABC transporter permease [Bryobacteraceae bacterium]